MKKAKDATIAKPRRPERSRKPWETFEWERIEALEQEIRRLMATSGDQQTVVDKIAADVVTVTSKVAALNDQVSTLTAEVAALKAVPPVVEQAQLDANVASLNDSAAKLEAL